MSDQDLTTLLDAAGSGKWILFAALIVGLLVRLLKSNPTLAEKVPARARPFLAVGLGIVSGVLTKVVSGTTWRVAIIGGVAAGAFAILGHQFVIEGIRNGKEIGESVLKTADTPPTPPIAIFAMIASVSIAIASWSIACSNPPSAKTVKDDALTAADLFCVATSTFLDVAAVSEACHIVDSPAVRDVLRNLIGQREAAKRAGFVWPAMADGGAPRDASTEGGR